MPKEWSNLASIVYKRTYARKTEGGLENWEQTINRVVQGNVRGHDVPEQEVKQLIKLGIERKATCAGRGLWFSGSPSHEKLGGTATVNCWFLTADNWNNFVIAEDLLMLGGGVGMSVEHRFSSKLPKVKKSVKIIHKATKDADYIVPDSREGWCYVIRDVLEAFFETGKSFSYSTVCLRGYGEPIVGFGGVASGPMPLIECIETLSSILNSREGKSIRPIDAADITTAIAQMVVSGNVRRSAIIILGDCWDKEYLRAKRWDLQTLPKHRARANYSVVCDDVDDFHPLFWKTYEQGEPFGIINRTNIQKYGRMGEVKKDTAIGTNPCQPDWAVVKTPEGIKKFRDISIGSVIWSGEKWTKVVKKVNTGIKEVWQYFTDKGTFVGTEDHHILQAGRKVPVKQAWGIDGEDGNTYKIKKTSYVGQEPVYDITVDCLDHTYWTDGLIVSNCGEATLESGEPCNLLELALCNLKDADEFEKAARLMMRFGKRTCLQSYHHAVCDEVIKRNMRVGIGITGCLSSPLFKSEHLDRVYDAILDEDAKYSKELGVPKSIRHTVVKPSGTLGKVFDCGQEEGIHGALAPYIIQRVQFSSNDALIPLLKNAGHFIEPLKNFDGTVDPRTMVADFYVAAPEGAPTVETGWDTWKQLDAVKTAQKHWADQSVSVTVYYKEEEIPKVKDWLGSNLNDIKTISFLKYSGHGFLQAPKEPITKEQYETLSAKIKPLNTEQIMEGEISSQECETGGCPIK